MDWVKPKETTGKIEPPPQLLAEERLTFQKSIGTVAYDSNKPDNLDQTSLYYASSGI